LMADAAHLREYRSLAGERVVRAPLAGVGDLFFNTRDTHLANTRIRRALIQAIDWRRVVDNATRGAQAFEHANRGLFSWGYDPAIQPPKFDPTAAARVLKGVVPSLQFSFVAGNAVASAIGVQLQQQLRAAGVELILRSYSPLQFRADASSGGPIYSGRFQIAFLEIYTGVDPDTDWYFGCRQIPPGGFNTSWYCDSQTDRAAAAGLATYDRLSRRRYAAVVQRRIMEELPSLALWQQNAIYVIPSGLHGFRPAEDSPVWNIADWTMDAARQ
nr:ABC transporter substrate-binding protein [Candidatus Eremiobacteraeota bacterium]